MQALRVDRPVYPRRVDHSTLVKGGIENGARLARQDPLSDSCPTAASLMITSRLALTRAAKGVPRRAGHV